MSNYNGVLSKCGLGEETVAYGTAATATEMQKLLSESISPEISRVASPILDGTAAQREDRRGNLAVAGDIEVELDYDNNDLLFEAAFGNAAGGVYTLIETEATSLTVWIEKTVSRMRALGAKVNSFTLAGSAGENWMGTFSIKAQDSDIVATAFASISLTSSEPWAFDSSKIRLGTLDDALTDNDQIYMINISIEVNHNLEDGIYRSNSDNPLEHLKGGFRDVKISGEIARYDTDQYATWEAAETQLQMDITIPGSGSNNALIEFPVLKISQVPNVPVGGPGPAGIPIEFMAYLNSSRNSYIDATKEIRLTITT